MAITIIYSSNVVSALAEKLADAGHKVIIGVRDLNNFKSKKLLNLINQ